MGKTFYVLHSNEMFQEKDLHIFKHTAGNLIAVFCPLRCTQCPGFSCSISAQWRVWQHLCQVQKSRWLYTQSSTYCRIQTIANSTWQKKEPLIQDIPTRWNSTFNMIKSICRNKPHIKFVIPITAETDKLQTGNETRCLQVNLTEHILSFRPIFSKDVKDRVCQYVCKIWCFCPSSSSLSLLNLAHIAVIKHKSLQPKKKFIILLCWA